MNTISVCWYNMTTCMHTIMGKHEVMHAQHEGTALHYDCTHIMRAQLYIMTAQHEGAALHYDCMHTITAQYYIMTACTPLQHNITLRLHAHHYGTTLHYDCMHAQHECSGAGSLMCACAHIELSTCHDWSWLRREISGSAKPVCCKKLAIY